MRKSTLKGIRAMWYVYYRQLRIIRRETTKQWLDTLLYGTGYVEIGTSIPDGIRHVPIQDVVIHYEAP